MNGTQVYVFNAPCNYNVILGRDVLLDIGMDLLFNQKEMRWLRVTV